MVFMEAGQEIGSASADSLEVAVVDPKGSKVATDGTRVTTENVIGVAMEDLSEKDWEEVECELQHELKEEMAERCRKKLAYF
jgi:hypothetical protein